MNKSSDLIKKLILRTVKVELRKFMKKLVFSMITVILIVSTLFMGAPKVHASQLNYQSDISALKGQLLQIQKTEVARILSERTADGYWSYPPPLGISYAGQYWLITKWLGHPIPDFDTKRFIELVLNEQLADGSWYYLPDKTIKSGGNISVTILNYWTLKAMGVSLERSEMLRAKEFIVKAGGLESANNFVKFLLMTFGNLDWDLFPTPPNIPLISVNDVIGFIKPTMGRWMHAFLPPVAYLANLRVSKNLGPNFQVLELLKNPKLAPRKSVPEPDIDLRDLVMTIYRSHRPLGGSWGGSTPSTLYSMMVLQHAQLAMPDLRSEFQAAMDDAYRYLHLINIESGDSAYRGAIFDGRYWDTVLLGTTLLESGVSKKELAISAQYTDRFINRRTGGMSFGWDYEVDPDTDDTSEMIIFYNRGRFFDKSVVAGVHWLSQMQNTEDQPDGTPGIGGWGSYSKNNNPKFPVDELTEKFKDSTGIFDPATPDVTGHILEALGSSGFRIGNSASPMILKAVEYMRRSQRSDGTWFGRWGVNSIYGTAAAVVGLRSVGISESDPMIVNGLTWLSNCQKLKTDGGFGESFLSYSDSKITCQNTPSTPTQTAWALLALESSQPVDSYRILKALKYLVQSYDEKIGWKDEQINGTGHPVVTPMFYPVYAKVFPLQAISRWLNSIEKTEKARNLK